MILATTAQDLGATIARIKKKMRRKTKMIECYVGNYVVYKEFGKTKITAVENYEAVIRDANKVITFDGTIYEAVEYIKQYFGGAEQ